jgi:UDP-glucose 4-epimerase
MTDIKCILITGVSGFLGRAIAHHFSRRGILVYGVDRASVENAPIADLKAYSALTLPEPRFDSLLAEWQPQAVIHCAGRASVPQSMQNPAEDYRQGPALSFYVLDAIRRITPECVFLLLSSAAVYGNPVRLPIREDDPLAPISVYGFHKWQSELICQEFTRLYGQKTASARVFSAYGIGLRRQVMWDIAQKVLTQNEIILQGDGSESRDFLHSVDIANALDCILHSAPLHGEAYNVASGEEIRIDTLAAMIVRRLAPTVAVKFSGALPAGTPKNWRADISFLLNLGYKPTIDLFSGVESFVTWVAKETTVI